MKFLFIKKKEALAVGAREAPSERGPRAEANNPVSGLQVCGGGA